mgnify:CR=1 FL=1
MVCWHSQAHKLVSELRLRIFENEAGSHEEDLVSQSTYADHTEGTTFLGQGLLLCNGHNISRVQRDLGTLNRILSAWKRSPCRRVLVTALCSLEAHFFIGPFLWIFGAWQGYLINQRPSL